MKARWHLLVFAGLVAAAITLGLAMNRRATVKQIAASPASVRTFQVSGHVRVVDVATRTITVAHEAIPGYMPAMTMPLLVKDEGLLDGLRGGDEIHFELSVSDDDSWISHLEKIRDTAIGAAVEGVGRAQAGSSELHQGEAVPDFNLIDQNGKPVRLSDFRGKAVVLTFIYTRCPLPNFCPLMSKNFGALQERLTKTTPGQFHLLSVSMDPKFDTPEVLKQYSVLYHADERSWSFATGSEEDINSVTATFGLVREPESGLISHNLRTALIGPDGRLRYLWKSNVWIPYEVDRMLREALSEPKVYSDVRHS